ncbi:hypothetical protein JX266_011046 [Neoarthrinium moseri]|nr:hypothetical protein JX266_011046 [Neoarthrinium moseri]
MASEPYTVRWGIMATGGIAQTFTKDLLTNPATRDVHDIAHKLVAVASSSSKASAESFLSKVKAPDGVKTYGSYAELVADPDVDIVYVATPHSHHFQNAMLALEAGKNVLCEKAFTVTAAQAKKLVDKAKAKNLFLMEAVWTRYFPLSVKVREMVQSGVIGPVYRVIADNSFGKDAPNGRIDFPDEHRMVNPDLAGGALLDLGIYSLTWLFQILYHCQPESEKEKPNVVGAINKYTTGADEMTTVVVQFPKHKSMGVGMTCLRINTDTDGHNSGGPAIKIQGPLGEIQVMGPAFKPLQYRVVKSDCNGKVEVIDCPIPQDKERNWGHGMFWEADECARCLRDGKKESATLPLSESIVIMEVMEEVLKQGDVKYPDLITTDVYDPKSPLNTGNQTLESEPNIARPMALSEASSSRCQWHQSTHGVWERDIDECEEFYRRSARGDDGCYPLTGFATFVAVSIADGADRRIEAAFRNAWARLRYEHPTLGSHIEDKALGGSKRVYSSFEDASQEEEWLQSTFKIVHTDGGALEWFNNSSPTFKTPTLFLVKAKAELGQTAFLRCPHDLTDGIQKENATIYTQQRLLGLPSSASAGSTSRIQYLPHYLPKDVTDLILRGCKVIGPGVSVTHVFTAALALALADMQLREDDAYTVRYANQSMINLRPYCEPPYNTSSHVAAAYHTVSAQALGIDLIVPSKSGKTKADGLPQIATSVRDFFKTIRPACLEDDQVTLSPSVFKSITPAPGANPHAVSDGNFCPVALSSVGNIDNVVKAKYGVFELTKVAAASEPIGSGVALFLGSWGAQLSLFAVFDSRHHDTGYVEKFMDRVWGPDDAKVPNDAPSNKLVSGACSTLRHQRNPWSQGSYLVGDTAYSNRLPGTAIRVGELQDGDVCRVCASEETRSETRCKPKTRSAAAEGGCNEPYQQDDGCMTLSASPSPARPNPSSQIQQCCRVASMPQAPQAAMQLHDERPTP